MDLLEVVEGTRGLKVLTFLNEKPCGRHHVAPMGVDCGDTAGSPPSEGGPSY